MQPRPVFLKPPGKPGLVIHCHIPPSRAVMGTRPAEADDLRPSLVRESSKPHDV
jgi:hypothetical protein